MGFYESYFHQRCHVVHRGDEDRWGKRAIHAEVYLDCMYRYQDQLVQTKTGETVTSSAHVFIAPIVDIRPDDSVEIYPDTKTYTVVKVEPIYESESIVDCKKVYLK